MDQSVLNVNGIHRLTIGGVDALPTNDRSVHVHRVRNQIADPSDIAAENAIFSLQARATWSRL
jgi:hypothetical protein